MPRYDPLNYLLAQSLMVVVIMRCRHSTASLAGSTARYLPFGDWRTEPTADETSRWYTGHVHDNLGRNDLGLIYMNARFHLPHIVRFASADSVVPGKENPQAFNRYAYVANNPLLFLDESGHCWGAFSFVRDINVGGYGYGTITTCSNIDQALTQTI